MRVRVIVPYGRFVKGDVFLAHKTTAEALVAHKVVEIVPDTTPLFIKVENDAELAKLKVEDKKPKTEAEKMSKDKAFGIKSPSNS